MKTKYFILGMFIGILASVLTFLITEGQTKNDARAVNINAQAKVSYAQFGEDLILANIFDFLKIPRPTYLDIGAWDPIIDSNTYLFYLRGSRGVLVEPNPAYLDKLKKTRKGDVILAIGIGVTDQKNADYYIIGKGDGQEEGSGWNTFSKENAENAEKISGGTMKIEKVIKRPLVNINKVLEENFEQTPDLISIDVEGLDLSILKSLDFKRFRPKVFCVETFSSVDMIYRGKIIDLMTSKGYVLHGGNFVNAVFVDKDILKGI
jgi:FkbM family methyltransferase